MVATNISYAQCFEDILLRRSLKNVDVGFYIDIGSFDPILHSVTKIFYDSGWSGVNIEPNPKFYKKLVEDRNRDINLDIAISDIKGSVKLNIIQDTGLTTIVDEMAQKHSDAGLKVDITEVEVRPLKEVWNSYVPVGKDVHFLKIDVEGAEEAVIRSGDWVQHRPWIVVVEAVLPNSSIPSHHAWDPLLKEAGYIFANFDGLNRYYVAKEHAELLEEAEIPANIAVDDCMTFEEKTIRDQLDTALGELARAKASHAGLIDALDKANTANVTRMEKLADLIVNNDLSTRKLSLLQDFLHRRPKPLWEKFLFRSSGKPKKPVRKLLFHSSGKPRGIFRKWVLMPDGQPRAVFYNWMSSSAYQKLRKPAWIAPHGLAEGGHSENELPSLHNRSLISSPRAREMKVRLLAAIVQNEGSAS